MTSVAELTLAHDHSTRWSSFRSKFVGRWKEGKESGFLTKMPTRLFVVRSKTIFSFLFEKTSSGKYFKNHFYKSFPFPFSSSLFLAFQYSWHYVMFHIKHRWLYLHIRSLVSKATIEISTKKCWKHRLQVRRYLCHFFCS